MRHLRVPVPPHHSQTGINILHFRFSKGMQDSTPVFCSFCLSLITAAEHIPKSHLLVMYIYLVCLIMSISLFTLPSYKFTDYNLYNVK